MRLNKYDLALNLFTQLRKEIIESQKIRTQIIGFKITFVSAAIGVIAANLDRIPKLLFIIPAFASVFFDLLITSYNFSIQRIGFYCRNHLEPTLKGALEARDELLLWQEFLTDPKTKQKFALLGNIGMTFLTIPPAIYGTLFPTRSLWSILLFVTLIIFLILDLKASLAPDRFREYMKKENIEDAAGSA